MSWPRSAGWLRDVDQPELDIQGAVRSLPRAHLLLLRAALVGFEEAELAALIDVPQESVRPLLRIAAAKLTTCLADTGTDTDVDVGVDVEPAD
jgi:DNA-directed RNA polymerase specialized sigma24 family protein